MNRASRIPNVFHFVFGLREQPEEFHLMYYLCLASCIEVNRPDEVHFHYHNEPYGAWWDRIRPKLRLRRIEPEPFALQYAYDNPLIVPFRYARLSDFSRLRILVDEGGIYADIDTLFLRPFSETLLSQPCVLGREKAPPAAPEGESLCNAWIAAEPGSEFCRRWLDGLADAFDGTWSNHSTLFPYRLSQEFPSLVHVEPGSSFYALDWTPRGLNDLFMRSVRVPDTAYSLHLWSHLWFDRKRLDSSHFHKDLLTVDYVAYAETTYAHLARRFLPEDVACSKLKYYWQTAWSILRYPSATARCRLEAR